MDEEEFKSWQSECAKWARKLVHLRDILDEDDPYDLFDAMEEYYEEGTTPEDFIREMFAEDLASAEYDNDLRRQSEEYEEEDDYDGPDSVDDFEEDK